jgi:hypothetical protein
MERRSECIVEAGGAASAGGAVEEVIACECAAIPRPWTVQIQRRNSRYTGLRVSSTYG